MADGKVQDFFRAMWLAVILRGLASLVFGVIAFIYPGFTLGVLVTVFGIYAIVDGLTALWSAVKGNGKAAGFLQGLASLAAGVFCLALPAVAVVYVVLLIGIWNIAVGVLQIAGAFVLRERISNAFLLGLGGALAALLGVIIVLYPAGGALSIIWLIAGTAVLVGLVLIAFGYALKQTARSVSR